LFPYVRNNVKTYLESKFDSKETQEDIEKLKSQAEEDLSSKDFKEAPQIKSKEKSEMIEETVANITWNMDKDRKMAALKNLQGKIWEDAYKNGEIKGTVYPDVVKALKRWKKQSKSVFIYSSGSVYAQKLLFGHSDNSKEPDLLKYLQNHYDTGILSF
jgi:enolase-phosphatase E1